MAQFFNFKEDYYGLTESDIDKNIALYGFNIYTKNEKAMKEYTPLNVLLSPSFILMFVAGVLCFFGAGIGFGIAALLIDFAYAAVEIYFGIASDKRLAEIKESTDIKFRVVRNGKLEFVDKEYIVPEDTIIIQMGERVPADAYVLESRDLTVDESIFTGSNKPVAKYAGAITKTELSPKFVYSGTTVLTGVAICRVSAIGVDTKLYQKLGEQKNRHGYYTETEEFVHKLVPLCSIVATVVTLITVISGIFTDKELIPNALRGITIGLCFLPTGISTVMRIYYTRGASDMLKKSAVVKSLCDIERLNSLSVLCVEKEGAISKSRVEVRGMYAKSNELLYKVAALACEQNTSDPSERALLVKASFFDENISELYNEYTLLERIPESNEIMSGALWDVGGSKLYCIKGTPEQILPLCRLHGDALYAAQKKYTDYYSQGYSVLAFACADAQQGDMDSTAGFAYVFVGFAAFSAPLRESVSAAVKTCRRSGVRVVMLTEDNPSVAEAVGKMIGLSGHKAVTGKQISDYVKYGGELDLDADIFARVTPEQKLYIIDQLRKKGEVVAMTGTHTTDADAMNMADIGITISQHTDGSTYEAADIIMNDDNFSSIADTIAAARQIHRNVKRAFAVVISGYISLILPTAINSFSDKQMFLNPPLLALLTMIILPVAALGYIGNRCDIKSNMPPSEFFMNQRLNLPFLGEIALMGALTGAVTTATYLFMYHEGLTNYARSCALISFSFCTALFGLLRLSPDKPLSAVKAAGKIPLICAAATFVIPLILIYIPFVNSAFGLDAVDIAAAIICVITGLLPGVMYLVIKHFIKFN